MRILVCGHRDFDDWSLFCKAMQDYLPEKRNDITIIEGEAKGADFLARVYAKWAGYKLEAYPADWNKYGKGAGPIRNKQMLVEGKPDLVVAFLAEGSIGTKNMIKQAMDYGVEVRIVNI